MTNDECSNTREYRMMKPEFTVQRSRTLLWLFGALSLVIGH